MVKPVKGFRSSFVASILALLLLTLPLFAGNYLDKTRKGEGKFSLQDDEMVFDLNEKKEVNPTLDFSGVTSGAKSGTGAFVWYYFDTDDGLHTNAHNLVSMLKAPLNGTIGSYAVSSTRPKENSDIPGVATELLAFGLNFTKKKMTDLDLTRIDIYLEIQDAPFNEMEFYIADEDGKKTIGKTISLGNLTKITISVADLLGINSLSATKKIIFLFEAPGNDVVPFNKYVVFDTQWYSIKEIRTPTLTSLGVYMAIGGIGYLFLAFVVSPEYTIEGIWNTIKKAMGDVRKK